MKKKKKKRKGNIHIKWKRIIPLVIVLALVIVFIIKLDDIILKIDSWKLGYDVKTLKVLKEDNLYDKVKDNKYSKTLEMAIKENKYNEEYFNVYLNIDYVERTNFIDNVNTLASLGYNGKDINIISKKLDDKQIELITKSEYNKDIANYLQLDYFKVSNLNRYLDFYNDPHKLSFSPFYKTDLALSYEDIITYVNANLDTQYYQHDITLSKEDSEQLDVIVNKYYKLDKDYVPSDLEEIDTKYASSRKQEMRHDAKVAFEKMAEDALKENIKIYAGSTYRSYSYQLGLYNRYVASDGFDNAETFSARAGYSEHQTGLAVDVLNGRWDYISEDDVEYSWLVSNCYKYGFILRYPHDKEYITGYMFEDWHYRYLGEELAKKVYDSKLTYEEYVARYGNSKEK